MSRPRIGIVISTTRQGRFGDKVAAWIAGIAAERTDLDFEIVDLRDYPLPMFDSVMSPRFAPIDTPAATRWATRMAELDGYVFVTAEYNRSISAVLKNALDHIYFEPARKPPPSSATAPSALPAPSSSSAWYPSSSTWWP